MYEEMWWGWTNCFRFEWWDVHFDCDWLTESTVVSLVISYRFSFHEEEVTPLACDLVLHFQLSHSLTVCLRVNSSRCLRLLLSGMLSRSSCLLQAHRKEWLRRFVAACLVDLPLLYEHTVNWRVTFHSSARSIPGSLISLAMRKWEIYSVCGLGYLHGQPSRPQAEITTEESNHSFMNGKYEYDIQNHLNWKRTFWWMRQAQLIKGGAYQSKDTLSYGVRVQPNQCLFYKHQEPRKLTLWKRNLAVGHCRLCLPYPKYPKQAGYQDGWGEFSHVKNCPREIPHSISKYTRKTLYVQGQNFRLATVWICEPFIRDICTL